MVEVSCKPLKNPRRKCGVKQKPKITSVIAEIGEFLNSNERGTMRKNGDTG